MICPHGCPNDSYDACDRNGSRTECNSACCPAFVERPSEDPQPWTKAYSAAELATLYARAYAQALKIAELTPDVWKKAPASVLGPERERDYNRLINFLDEQAGELFCTFGEYAERMLDA